MRANNNQTRPGQGTQISVERKDGSPVALYKCSRCVIFYNSVEPAPSCPLCTQEIKTEQMRQALQNSNAKVELLEKRNRELDSRDNLQSALRAAADLLNDEDRVFLKSVLYRYREDRSVTLRLIGQPKPNGFMAEYRDLRKDVEALECTSIGGMAIVGYYKEALNTVGSAKAMEILMRGLQHMLPGATS